MWFRNLLVYRIVTPWKVKADDFNDALAKHGLQPCGSFAMESRGWVPPREDDRFVYEFNKQWLFALGIDQKLLPSTVIKQVADERAAAVEKKQGHPVRRKQLRDLQ